MLERILLGASDSGGPFWIDTYYAEIANNYQVEAAGLVVDTDLNVYAACNSSYDGQIRLLKFSRDGVLSWQNRLSSGSSWFYDVTTGGGKIQGKTLCVDASNKIYGTLKISSSIYSYTWNTIKVNASAGNDWTRTFDDGVYGGFNAVDTGGRMYQLRLSYPNSLMRIDSQSDGTHTARFTLSGSSPIRPLSVSFSGTWGMVYGVIDRGNPSWIFRQTWNGLSNYGNNAWGVDPAMGYDFLRGHDAVFDSGYDTIMVGRDGSTYGWVVKAPFLSGSISWARRFNNCQLNQVVVDSARNVIVAGATMSGAYPDGVFIAKMNSSGTVLWQRRLSQRNISQLAAYNLAVDVNGNIYIAMNGYFTSNNKSPLHVAKLPGDGSLTGTYGGGDWTYASHSATVDTTIFLINNTSESGGTITVTDSTNSNSSTTNNFVATTSSNSVVTIS